ncbi:MAG: penicillin-binding transpeptidase domain-containing protein [Lachnospiraceae bacterium]|nr:penicillin-binding transpeptidase domain-containing protein [Lachnospiraceae bacterium]
MVKKIKKWFQKLFNKRTSILLCAFLLLSGTLIIKLFSLQIIKGEEYTENFNLKITKTRTLKGSRGNIYDCNGNVLASNRLANSITLEDNGSYSSSREKNLSLNGEIYRLIKLIEENGDKPDNDFHIYVDENDQFVYDLAEGTTSLNRFRADIYGENYVDNLKAEQLAATPDDLMNFLMGSENNSSFALFDSKTPYTSEELSAHGLPDALTKQEQLQIVIVRYQLRLTSFQKFMPVTVATDVRAETVAAVEENQNSLQGVAVSEDSIRVYSDAEYFASLLGYTGKPSAEELEDLTSQNASYDSSSIIGKSGMEQYMETTLQGVDGSEKVIVDSMGKVLQIDDSSLMEPQQGNDVYLTIDKNLQEACYKILEQRIAGIVVSNLQNIKEYIPEEDADTATMPIPIYDVYSALFENSVIDISHFTDPNATQLEQDIQQRFLNKQQETFAQINEQLTGSSPAAYKDLSDEYKEYMSYIVSDMLMGDSGILSSDLIDKSDSVYKQWQEGTISLQEYLNYAASQSWIDISKISDEKTYLNSSEVYQSLAAYIAENLTQDNTFSKRLYHYMLMEDKISGNEVCKLMYDQNLLTKDDDLYKQFNAGNLKAYDLLYKKIQSLEITPAQLALDPCSGSIVITDPNTGVVRACVSYPGYDNNKLANKMDTAYYNKLHDDLSTPFYNKATQQSTAPGSTFKPVTTAASLTEGVIDNDTVINCNGLFGPGLVETSDFIHCWYKPGHGDMNVISAISNSCNVFFCTAAFRLGLNEDGVFSQNLALSKLQQYAQLFELDKKSGLEITEATPRISQDLAIPSAIGQGTHSYTTAGLARYVSTIANSGTSFSLSLLSKVTDASGNTITEYTPAVSSSLSLSEVVWDDIHQGMQSMAANNEYLNNLPVEVYGKTGTAQESDKRPSHGLYIGFSHKDGTEDMAMAVRIAYGYSSTNAAAVAHDVLCYYYGLEDEASLLAGTASQGIATNAQTD